MKINSRDLHELPQDAIDIIEDIKLGWNFGKYQPQVSLGVPSYVGRQGEMVIVFLNNTGRLYWCVTDGKATWAPLAL